jgi:hypothetical protein
MRGMHGRACGRLLHLDDIERLDAYRELLSSTSRPAVNDPASRTGRLVRMLVASLCDQAVTKEETLEDGLNLLWGHPQVRAS